MRLHVRFQSRLVAAVFGGAALMFLLAAGGLLPAHLAHDHDVESDHSHRSCDLCLKITANPAVTIAVVMVPVPEAEGAVAGGPVLRTQHPDPSTQRGRAPPLPVPVS